MQLSEAPCNKLLLVDGKVVGFKPFYDCPETLADLNDLNIRTFSSFRVELLKDVEISFSVRCITQYLDPNHHSRGWMKYADAPNRRFLVTRNGIIGFKAYHAGFWHFIDVTNLKVTEFDGDVELVNDVEISFTVTSKLSLGR